MVEKPLVIVGDSAFAEIAYEYFTHDSQYTVVAFSVEGEFISKREMFGLPVYPFETLAGQLEPARHSVFVAITYTQMNRLRERLASAAVAMGFSLASYVSSRSFVWRNVAIGDHCFIFEDNTLQPFVSIGSNSVLWSGNHIGHHSKISENCFISSHVVIAGYCDVGRNSFLGVNCTISNNVTLGQYNWVNPGVVATRDTSDAAMLIGGKPTIGRKSSLEFFKLTGGIEN